MIAIEQLRYVRLGARDLEASADFAQRILGLELVEKDSTQAAFRSDFRDHTLVFTNDNNPAQTVGFEVRDAETLEQAADTLARNGYDVTPGASDQAARRKVKSFVSFTDASGVTIDLVVRPLHSGWRYFPSRDAGITGLEAVALRSAAVAKGEALWTGLLGGKVSDWVGDAAFIRFDGVHHRLALHPSPSGGVLAVEFGVESVDQLMQSSHFLQDQQVRIAHGPGRRPVSGQMFLTFAGPDGVLFSYVADGNPIVEATHRPRQFPRRAQSFCSWGSRSDIPEFSAETGSGMKGARA
jgi:2,3-dihydroxy-p-cumate/2,3-dihydroxybenzoate 3,4-dioxygenase